LEDKNVLDIKIDEDYKITSDGERNFILWHKRIITGENTKGREVKPENIGQERWIDEGYFRTIRRAIEEYTRLRTMRGNCKTFEELFKLLDEIQKTIQSIKDVDNLIQTNDIKEVEKVKKVVKETKK
jgi:hypothetical protein